MKPIPRLLILAGVLLGCVAGGFLAGFPGAAASGASSGEAVSARGSGAGESGRLGPGHATRGLAGPRVSPGIEFVLPGIRGPIADWRAFAPETLAVQLAPDLLLPFRVTQVQREHGRTVLTARLDRQDPAASGLDGAFLVGTANTSDGWEAVVVLPAEEYHIHVDQGQVSVEEVRVDGWSCGTNLRVPAAAPANVAALQTSLIAPTAGQQLTAAAVGDGSTYTVDVLFLYNSDALASKNGNRSVIDADCSNFIAASNAILENSRITNFRWNYLLAEAAPAYPTTSTLQDDLNQMTTGSIATFTDREQSACGADQVVMLVGGRRNDAAGVAWIGGGPNRVAVVYPCLTADGKVASTATSVIVVCHEMGHNFGCRHDRATENAPDGDGHYCYGFRFSDNSGANSVPDEGTVMSYAGNRLPYFSNPDIVYHGYALGVPIGAARASDNAETMAENAARIASTNAAKLEPAITAQPQSAAVQVGQRLSLAVTASGSSLTYQWFRGGTVLSGATSATYTVGSAALGDAGTYTVTASNVLGAATSDPASVTVSPAAGASPVPAVSVATATGGGSSGGGAFDSLSALALLTLLALSRMGRRGAA